MIHTLIPLLTALLLSGIAAFYSIIGLFQIFPGAKLPILLMGGALELAKLVTAAWLYRNWSRTPFLLKTYFLAAVTILMLITSKKTSSLSRRLKYPQSTVSAIPDMMPDGVNTEINSVFHF